MPQNVQYLAQGSRTGIRPFTLDDGPEFTARARRSKELHQPWLFPPDSLDAYAQYAGRLIEDPARAGFLVCELDPRGVGGSGEPGAFGDADEGAPGAIAGFININNIVHGGFRSGALGYGAFAHAAGRGLMSEGLALVIRHAFGPALNLHRLEINVQPRNTASIALARRAGFRLEGFSPDMIYIAGAWRDHERWAITAEMVKDTV